MVSVTISYPLQLRAITKRIDEKIELPDGATLEDVFHLLSKRYGVAFAEYVFDSEGNVRNDVLLLLNGRSVGIHKELFGTTLGQEDLLTILSPLSGG